jgi:hypothetical protein
MGLLRGMARTAVVAGTATAVSNRVSRRQAARWSQEDPGYGYAQAPPAPAPAPAAAPDDSLTAELERLATLRDRGLLSDEEFSAAKGRLLGA